MSLCLFCLLDREVSTQYSNSTNYILKDHSQWVKKLAFALLPAFTSVTASRVALRSRYI
jgi:hypothetical protein